MADFCKQCSLDTFNEDYQDFCGLTSQAAWEDGSAVMVICEGCGPIQVDPLGNCASDCLHKDAEGHNMPWLK